MNRAIADNAQPSAGTQRGRKAVAPPSHVNEGLADRIAAGVMSKLDSTAVNIGTPSQSPSSSASVAAPESVGRVLRQPGQPLDRRTRSFVEPRFGRDFSSVRIHRDIDAERSADAIGALAYSSGDQIVFGRGAWRPDSAKGLSLLTHELAHVAQGAHSASARQMIWRKATVDLDDFDSGDFADATLTTYLKTLRDTLTIEDNSDSDDKARGVVRKWLGNNAAFVLEPHIKVLLIKEMQSGFTGDDDERAILNLLEKSPQSDVDAMFKPGQLDPEDLDSDFHGAEEDAYRAFYDAFLARSRTKAAAGQAAAAERAKKNAQIAVIDGKIGAAPNKAEKDALLAQKAQLQSDVEKLDQSLQADFRDVAKVAPKTESWLEKLTSPLDPKTKQAAKVAIAPQTQARIEAEAKGVAPPPPPVFKPGPLPGEKDTYEDKIRKRIPDLIQLKHDNIAKNRTEKEHKDPTKSRSMDDMQRIANRAKVEVDFVFGNFYNPSDYEAFQGDKRNDKGELTRKGNLRDAWQVKEDQRKADPAFEKQSAKFWLFYLIQNDGAVAVINKAHDASPSFGNDSAPLDDEAKIIRKVGDPFVTSEQTRLFEIGRAWDAVHQGGDIFIQLFKKPDAAADRRFVWDMYLVLMHEYLHKLVHKDYYHYAEKLGGESSTEGNTLIEGVDSLLTEISWSNAVRHASVLEVRQQVEPDAVSAGLPFDASLLPDASDRRYANYANAVRLAGVVGIHNLYAAYFDGRVDLIGGA
jgi:hypothetical protein